MRRHLIPVIVASVTFIDCGPPRDRPPAQVSSVQNARSGAVSPSSGGDTSAVPWTPTDSLLQALRRAFQKNNPRLEKVRLLERRSFARPGSGSLVLARAIRADEKFSGDFNDEMFCIFRTRPDDRDVSEVIHCLPTPRWNDQTFRFEVIDPDSIVLMGTDSYGAQGAEVVRWHANDVSRYERPEDSWVGAVVEFSDTRDMTLYDRPGGANVPIDLHYEGKLDYGMRVQAIHDNWIKLVVWVPSMPGCDNDLDAPLRTDTVWTPLRNAEGARLRRGILGPC